MSNKKWQPIEYKPELPNGWHIEEIIEKSTISQTSIVRRSKVHHNDAEATKIYVVFCEYSPEENPSYRYSVRGGRSVKPEEKLRFFNDIKAATDYIVYLTESTNRWLDEILSEKYIKAYNNRISKLVEEDARKKEYAREVLESL